MSNIHYISSMKVLRECKLRYKNNKTLLKLIASNSSEITKFDFNTIEELKEYVLPLVITTNRYI